jgi:hypothetical protein
MFGSSPYGSGFGSPFPSELDVFIGTAVVVAIAFVLAAARTEADPDHVRPFARYLGAIILVTLFVTLFAAFSTAFALSDLVVDHRARAHDLESQYESEEFGFSDLGYDVLLPVAPTEYDFSAEPNNDANYSAAVASGLVALTAGAILAFHLRARRRLDPDAVVVARIDRVARLGVCFITGLTIAIALTSLAFGLFEIAAPGIAIGGPTDVARAEGISEALAFGFLALAAWLLFRNSWRRVAPRVREVAPPAAAPSS